MSHQGDTLAALKGVLAVFRKMTTNFLLGFPEALFDEVLLWMQLGAHRRRDVGLSEYAGKRCSTWSRAAGKSIQTIGQFSS